MAPAQVSKAMKAGTVALTVAAAGAALVYLFLLLVPHWRLVQVDRALLQRRLLEADNASQEAWRWLQHGVQLRARSANLFRECLWDAEGNDTRPLALPDAGGGNGSARAASDLLDVANDTSASAGAECWLLDLRWAEGLGGLRGDQLGLLVCLRALFLLALLLLCCYFVAMVSALYACFSSALGRSCALALLTTQCSVLCLLVALTVLQDVARQLLLRGLRRRVEQLFPPNTSGAVAASTGVCCLALLCLLVGLAVLQLLLLLFVSRSALLLRRHGNKPADSPEGDEDQNPLIM